MGTFLASTGPLGWRAWCGGGTPLSPVWTSPRGVPPRVQPLSVGLWSAGFTSPLPLPVYTWLLLYILRCRGSVQLVRQWFPRLPVVNSICNSDVIWIDCRHSMHLPNLPSTCPTLEHTLILIWRTKSLWKAGLTWRENNKEEIVALLHKLDI